MDAQTQKLELIQWIAGITDLRLLGQVSAFKKDQSAQSKHNKRHFGGGKHIITHIADDFNEPLDAFRDYMP